jgi:hypothetical protein
MKVIKKTGLNVLLAFMGSIWTSTIAAAQIPYLYKEAPQQIVAIGDLHGDYTKAKEALLLTGAVEVTDTIEFDNTPGLKWIEGNKMTLVQVGDQLDRGTGELQILDLFEDLSKQAIAAGGRVHVLNGNHEIMNASKDRRYIKKGALFNGKYDSVVLHGGEKTKVYKNDKGEVIDSKRAVGFKSGGDYAAKKLAGRNTVLIIGDNLFVHGGVTLQHIKYSLARYNKEIQAWLRGDDNAKNPDKQFREINRYGKDKSGGPVWSRKYSYNYAGSESDSQPTPEECKELEQVLTELAIQRMIVAHSPYPEIGINAACDGRVWRIDVGMSRGVNGSKPEVLMIEDDRCTVLKKSSPQAKSDKCGVPVVK